MKEIMSIIVPICFLLVLPLAVVISLWLDKQLEKNKRKKYPVYFEYYDAAIKICFEASAAVKHEASHLEFHFKMLADGLVDGECTEEYFKKRFDQLTDRYIEATKWFTVQQKEAEKLFREADLYAKENNLLWGVLY